MKPRGLDAELSPIPGLRQGYVPDVKLEIKVGIFDPIGMVKAKWDADDFLPETSREMKTRFDIPKNPLERDESAGGRRLIINIEATNMRGRRARLKIDEGGVESAELLHDNDLCWGLGEQSHTHVPRVKSPGKRTQSPGTGPFPTRVTASSLSPAWRIVEGSGHR